MARIVVPRRTDWKNTARAATTGALPANTISAGVITADSNGALPAQDGVTLIADEILLVKDEGGGTDLKNGKYFVTQVGDGSNPFILTRTQDADISTEVTSGMRVSVEEGTLNGGKTFYLSTANPITLGTTALTFSQTGAAASSWADSLATGANSGANNPIIDHPQELQYEDDSNFTRWGWRTEAGTFDITLRRYDSGGSFQGDAIEVFNANGDVRFENDIELETDGAAVHGFDAVGAGSPGGAVYRGGDTDQVVAVPVTVVRAGNYTGASASAAAAGILELRGGRSTNNAGSSKGSVVIYPGEGHFNGTGGDFIGRSGSVRSASTGGSSGNVDVRSLAADDAENLGGGLQGSGTGTFGSGDAARGTSNSSGDVSLISGGHTTGAGDGTGNSGSVTVASGDNDSTSGSADTGDVTIATGIAAGGTAGDVIFSAGTGGTADGAIRATQGNVIITDLLAVAGAAVSDAHADADDGVFGDGTGNRGLTVFSGTGSVGRIVFTDVSGSQDVGWITYAHGSGFNWKVESSTRLNLTTTALHPTGTINSGTDTNPWANSYQTGYAQFVEIADGGFGSATAGKARLWVESTAPNRLIFTDDDDTDWVLNQAAGGSETLAQTLGFGDVQNHAQTFRGQTDGGAASAGGDLNFDLGAVTTAGQASGGFVVTGAAGAAGSGNAGGAGGPISVILGGGGNGAATFVGGAGGGVLWTLGSGGDGEPGGAGGSHTVTYGAGGDATAASGDDGGDGGGANHNLGAGGAGDGAGSAGAAGVFRIQGGSLILGDSALRAEAVADYEDLIIGDLSTATTGGMTFLGTTTAQQGFSWADVSGTFRGRYRYAHSNDTHIWAAAGNDELVLRSSSLEPFAAGGLAFGTDSRPWSNMFSNGYLQLVEQADAGDPGATKIRIWADDQASPANRLKYTDDSDTDHVLGSWRQLVFTIPGTLAATTDQVPFQIAMDQDMVIEEVYITVGTAPTDASLIVDVNVGGTSMWSVTQANRPTITSTNFTATSGALDNPNVDKNDDITIDVDQVGSTVAGADLAVHIRGRVRVD